QEASGQRGARYGLVNTTNAAKEFSEDSSFLPKASNKVHQTMPTDASPDSKCPICLDRFDNVAYLDRCLHRFCFRCVQEWSKNKAECPLCKQPFFSIFHTVRAEDDFKEYILRPSENGSFASPDGRRFRYRTTLTRERRTSSYHRGSSSSRRTLSPPDNGILFEGLSSQPVQQRDGEIQQMIRRLASRRQASAEGRSLRQIQEEDMINFRRALYRTGVRVRSIQDGGRYRDISAELVPWLKRELTVLFGAHGSLVNIVQHIIMSNVTRYDLESQAFADDLKPFLLNRTEHFLHEFISFARCPFNLEAYDQHANYDCPAPSYDEGSRSDSSIITISPDEADPQGPEHSSSMSGVGQAPWDDETPGPSYSISEEVRATVASPLEMSESSDEDSARKGTALHPQLQAGIDSSESDSSSDNCVIVGYVKPLAERTPELVELSSDSEESIREEKREDVKKEQSIQGRSWSDSEPSRASSPCSPLCKENASSSFLLTIEKIKVKSLSPETDTICSPYITNCSRKRNTRSPQTYSQNCRDSHGHRSRRDHPSKCQSKKKRSRSRDGSEHRSKRSRRRSRTCDTSLSLKSQRGSLSRESTTSREVSRSRSRSKGHGKRRSRSRDSDYYYRRDNYQSRYQWGYAFYSRKTVGDGSFCRRRTQSKAHYSRQSASPEFRIQSFTERTDPHSQRGLHERHYYYYERCRSRSRSSTRSRTPSGGTDRLKSEKPGGKRKYKTRHLENAVKESTSLEREKDPKKTFSKFHDCCKNEDSLSDNRASNETKHKKKKKKMRSPSVEIVYEGKVTDTMKHAKKKKKKHKRKHRKHHMSNSTHSSPVVITIDSDSSKEPESTECDSSVTWTGTTHLNERECESPSSFLGITGCEDVYRVSKETSGEVKKYSIPTRGRDLDGDVRNAGGELVEETEKADQSLDLADTASGNTETVVSHSQEAQAAPSGQLSSPRTSLLGHPERPPLILRLPKRLVNRSCWFESLEKNM
uniref:E3 ubiquitin-protein ligase Topors n=1 Tax=Meleagris gallopavo TaxID=9103 RepID=A0A803Y4S0_MELGA